jgi:hypothetical protein
MAKASEKECNRDIPAEGVKSIPKACPRCGFGPCAKYATIIPIKAARRFTITPEGGDPVKVSEAQVYTRLFDLALKYPTVSLREDKA